VVALEVAAPKTAGVASPGAVAEPTHGIVVVSETVVIPPVLCGTVLVDASEVVASAICCVVAAGELVATVVVDCVVSLEVASPRTAGVVTTPEVARAQSIVVVAVGVVVASGISGIVVVAASDVVAIVVSDVAVLEDASLTVGAVEVSIAD
jgi:hypothetical protein